MWPKQQQQAVAAAAAAVIGICLLATASSASATATASTTAEGTTSLPLPLQPPTLPQNATTPLSNSAGQELDAAAASAAATAAAVGLRGNVTSKQQAGPDLEVNDSQTQDEQRQLELATESTSPFVGVPGFLPTPTALPKQEAPRSVGNLPTNGHGYIQFEINEEPPMEVVQRRSKLTKSKSKKDTVSEVLFSLFPNGFSDIFRYSGSEANTEPATDAPDPQATTAPLETSSTTEGATKKNETFYSYQATVTKEYRRELRPGHTQIVVEQISSAEREPFRDGSNHITQDELLRINRAAVASPVLPSLLLRPELEHEDNETLVAAESAPIVILGEHDSELDESEAHSIEDNQIAETRHMGQQLYRRLPAPGPAPEAIESYRNQKGPAEEQQINVHIVHDETLAQAQGSGKAQPQPQQVLDHYQAHSEQRFQQQHQSNQEAPSRQFLKTFKPVISAGADGPIAKGSFHYEGSQTSNAPAKQQQQQQLNTQAVASAPAAATPSPYAGYAGPTPNSLVYVTLHSPNPVEATPAPHPQLPSPHDYVSEAAAEPSQQHAQHAAAPEDSAIAHSLPETQLLVKPNGYTFVEVQKSVNIHNKLITEKDGRLVEQHETIYQMPPYHNNQFSQSYSPKQFVAEAAAAHAPEPAKNYVSLAAHPINVQQLEYDSSPQEGANVHLEVEHKAEHADHPTPKVVEKHIHVPYAVPQPVPVPVHVEHYVDRPYPVETIVEQPVPYPVETIVEKIVERHVPVEVERIVEKPVEKIVEKYVDRPMAIPIHVPVAIHMPLPPTHGHSFGYSSHPNALPPWSSQTSIAHIPPKVLQNYYTRMLKKLLPQFMTPAGKAAAPAKAAAKPSKVKPPVQPVRGEAPKVASFSLADMRFDLRPPPPPLGSPWLQGSRYIYNTLPSDLSAAAASAPAQMVKSYIGPVPATSPTSEQTGNEFDEFQRWRNGHSLKRSPDFGRNLQLEYGFKPPLVPSLEIDDKGMPLKQAEPDTK
ncbi:CG6280 [Drosophila busckii]|uniref:CG6280 n=1 Tax=Drosophila busckii TaxID=30019 RepID=A0A0M4EBQ7_DROBS|nr:uncharacterized protein LOC108594702 [Drosophila busckii]ALC41015.1 CG6280 [Drosophila busckii]